MAACLHCNNGWMAQSNGNRNTNLNAKITCTISLSSSQRTSGKQSASKYKYPTSSLPSGSEVRLHLFSLTAAYICFFDTPNAKCPFSLALHCTSNKYLSFIIWIIINKNIFRREEYTIMWSERVSTVFVIFFVSIATYVFVQNQPNMLTTTHMFCILNPDIQPSILLFTSGVWLSSINMLYMYTWLLHSSQMFT